MVLPMGSIDACDTGPVAGILVGAKYVCDEFRIGTPLGEKPGVEDKWPVFGLDEG